MDYINKFEQVYRKGAWFGDTWLEKLADVTEKEAFTSPAKGIHSIAQLVAHTAYWRWAFIAKTRNDQSRQFSMDSEENWMPIEKLKAKGWKAILEDFDDSQKQLLDLLKNVKPGFFEREHSPGNSWNYVTDGTLQHDVYHLGQLGLVKKMVRNS